MSLDVESFQSFEYIVRTKKEDRICFGSILPRHTSPIGKGLSSQQLMQVPEIFPKAGPGCYNTEKITSAFYSKLNKIRTKQGMVPVCNTASRFMDRISFQIPSPGRYNTCKFLTKYKQNAAPFSSSSKIKNKFNFNPGPGTYNISKKIKCRRTKFMDNFGVPKAVNAVEIICVNKAVDMCQKCNKICDGDYWQKDYTLFLCQFCRNEELTMHELYPDKILKEFKKIRNCFFMHDHQNTSAAIKILPLKKVRKKMELENYLTLYMG